jgi:hypothetical protein
VTNYIKTKVIESLSNDSIQNFPEKFLQTNTPVVFNDLSEHWPAKKKWNLDYLSEHYGELRVPVYSSQPAKDNNHQHAATKTLKLSEYFALLKSGENDLRMFFYNILQNAPTLLDDFKYPDIGLKFFKRLPVLFVGGKGSKVQMHYDIDYAHLLLCHFGGKKKVLLIPPEQTPYMYKVPYSFSSLFAVDFSVPDFEKYPALQKINGYTTELNHGDCLYIPPGYWHYITYEEASFSMTLRAFPRTFQHRLSLMKNIFITRTIDGLMRKIVGQPWNDRNERLAIEKTHKNLDQ